MALNRIWNNQGMKTILVDTNIILWTFSGGPDFREVIADIAPHYDLMIPTCIMLELKKLNTKESLAALEICKNIDQKNIGEGYADDMLIAAAKEGHLIATNDKDILKQLKILKLNALKIREKNKMMFTEGDMS